MEKAVIQGISLEISPEEALRALKMPGDAEEEDVQSIRQMLEDCLKIASPKAVYCVAPIEEKGEDFVVAGGTRIDSPLVRKNLEAANRIIPYVATCGREAEEWAGQFQDPLEAYWADGIKLLLLERIRRALTTQVRERLFPQGDMSSMSPGSLQAWPLTAQRTLFALIGTVGEDTGVELTDSCLMLPSKSNSGFFFARKEHYENCSLCPILTCPTRRAPYEGPALQE